jgi:hypothetical protein
MSFRTFKNCESLAAGCDQFVGDNIVHGGLIVFQLDDGQGNEASRHVISSTLSEPSELTMRESRAEDTLNFSIFSDAPFCGATAAESECGA